MLRVAENDENDQEKKECFEECLSFLLKTDHKTSTDGLNKIVKSGQISVKQAIELIKKSTYLGIQIEMLTKFCDIPDLD